MHQFTKDLLDKLDDIDHVSLIINPNIAVGGIPASNYTTGAVLKLCSGDSYVINLTAAQEFLNSRSFRNLDIPIQLCLNGEDTTKRQPRSQQ